MALLKEDGSLNWSEYDMLSESEQLREQATWTPEQWGQFYSRDGILTHDEFCKELDKIIEEIYGEEDTHE